MGFNDHYPEDYIEHNVICNICGKRFKFMTEQQEPGFRIVDELYCPYCGTLLARSMEVEFLRVEKLEDDSKRRVKKND